MRRLARRGFTLIELLTVVAITAILLTIIVVPVVQSFNLLRAAQGFSQAQEEARVLTERISREIANSAGVRDNSGIKGAITVRVPGFPPGPGVDGPPVLETLPYMKLDIIKTAEGEPGAVPGQYVNPITGKIDPTLHAPKGQPVLPVAPGQTIVRYVVGLRDPFAADGVNPGNYNDPYDGLLMNRNANQDNLYVLYRIEFQPYIWHNGQYVANTYPLPSDPAYTLGLFTPDGNGGIADFDDPEFLLPDGTAQKATRIRNWMQHATIISEFSRNDLISPVFNKGTRAVVYDSRADWADPTIQQRPRLVPLIQFRPERISSEPAEGMEAVRLGQETDNAGAIAPDVFRTRYGGWTNVVARTYPTGYNPNNVNTDLYEVGRTDPLAGTAGNPPGMSIYAYDPGSGTDDTIGGTELFDVFTYEQEVASGVGYPFSDAVQAANTRSGWLGNANLRALFVPYDVDSSHGKVVGSFNIDQVGSGAPVAQNLPAVQSDPINTDFANTWTGNPSLRPNIQRFIDLRVVNNPAGNTPSPLNPDPAVGFARASIVPGSDQVIGPDQNPGPNYGNPVRYVRTTGDPGPDQYRINYVNQPEPANYGLVFPGYPNPPPVYDPLNFVSTHLQSRYKAGYIQLNSDPNVPLPSGSMFQVFYRFQFTTAIPAVNGQAPSGGDTFAVDYDSRELMSVLLTVRNFPQTTIPNAQQVTMKATATVRNFIR